MHEDHNMVGKAHIDALMVHDFALLEWIGANSIRTSHYPYSEEFMDWADDHGIVVIDETPAVGMCKEVAAAIGVQVDTIFGPGAVTDKTREAYKEAIRELVERDKNRPSVVLWFIANEPESHTPESEEYFKPLFDYTRDLDPSGRPVGFVNVLFSPAQDDVLSDYADVIMINRYAGWYVHPGDIEAGVKWQKDELDIWEQRNKPVIFTEFGADTVAGIHSVNGAMFSEEYQTEVLQAYFDIFDEYECVQGEQVWNFADFQTSLGTRRVDGNKKGVFTRDRRPKAAAHQLRKRWTGENHIHTPQD